MTDIASDRPPYGAALVVTLLVFLGYLLTLAPTVTFWDAGEFIAAMKILGIPHPPGTPLFIVIGHVWGSLFPFGEFAYRTNLLTALFSAAGAGFFFLVAQETLRRLAIDLEPGAARIVRLGGGAAAALVAAFTFTVWQNSTETEVYMVATFSIAAICWLCHVWRARRDTDRAPRLLLMIVFLAGISVGNHLLALLVGPAAVMFLVMTLLAQPAAQLERRRLEWAQVAVVAGVWALLIGTGLGNTTLMVIGGICFLGAAAFAASSGATGFAVLTLLIAFVGVTPYLYLYIRSGQNPMINEAAPSTWDALLAVIRREQYPIRTPFDDPTVPHGPENPGRTLSILSLQIQNYLLYFDWQWARSLTGTLFGAFPLRTLFTLAFVSLGFKGQAAQRRADRPAWWLLLTLFLTTGIGLVIYMNFRPGYSLGFEQYPNPGDHEVRERDYFFVVSFLVWGLWAGIGLAAVARDLMAKAGSRARLIGSAVLAAALVPLALNWSAASRRHGPDATLAADFAYNLLNSVPPHGILFTYGDNDTFPLWWAQEVAGIRRDVTIVCLALANTDWYMRQLRDNPTRPFDEASAPALWRGRNVPAPDWPLHTMSNDEVAAASTWQVLPRDIAVQIGPHTARYPANTVLAPNDFLTIRVLQQNLGRRPIVWALTAGREYAGLSRFIVQRGMGFELLTTAPDTTAATIDMHRLAGAPLDVPTTERLVWDVYRYAELRGGDLERLESTSAGIAASLSLPATQLAYAFQALGDQARVIRNLELASDLSPNPAIRAALNELRLQGPGLLGDTPAGGAAPPP